MTPAATVAPERTIHRRPAVTSPPRRRATRPAPQTRTRTAKPRAASQRRTFAEQLVALPDSKLLVRLTRGRIWIALIGVMLMGLVFMQVSLLRLNTGIGNADQSIATLERANQQARTKVAAMSSGDRIQAIAEKAGMVMPAAGKVHYLRAGASATAAARNVTTPQPVKQLAAWQLGTTPSGVTGEATVAAAQNPAPAAAATQQAVAPVVQPEQATPTTAAAATTTPVQTTQQQTAPVQQQQTAATQTPVQQQAASPPAATTAAATGGASPTP